MRSPETAGDALPDQAVVMNHGMRAYWKSNNWIWMIYDDSL
jgi:inner membrane protein involved in colicin E2 resistance